MKKIIWFGWLPFLAVTIWNGCSSAPAGPVRTLIVTGQNNHNWQVSHKILQQMLEESGLFAVDITVSPETGSDMSGFLPDFTAYDLVVLDYNGDRWPEATEVAFTEFVANGGGVVVYHAADNAFPAWVEYNEMTALGGWEGRDERSGPYVYVEDGRIVRDDSPGIGGSHGSQHKYLMERFDADHPIVYGLPDKWLHATDELYDRMRGPGNIASLLYTAYSDPGTGGTGRNEPLIFTVVYGKGRIFHTMLGHAGPTAAESPSMQCVGFQATLLRGAEWAATGKVTQPVPEDFPSEVETSVRGF